MMEYKGYHAEVVFDHDSHMLCGWIYGISDLVTFESDNAAGIIEEFHSAVEDYLEHCKANGKKPKHEMNPYLSFEVTHEIHKSLLEAAKKIGKTPDELVEKILTDYLAKTA